VRGHDLVGVGGENAGDEFALFGIAGDDRSVAGTGGGEGGVADVEAEFAFAGGGVGAVAVVAVFREDGLDVAAEVDFSGRETGGGEKRGEGEQTRESKRDGGH
jgi:hypothetical protein